MGLTKSDRNAALIAAASTSTVRELTEQFGLTHQRVRQILSRAAVRPLKAKGEHYPGSVLEAHGERLRGLLVAGWSYKQVCRETGLSRSEVLTAAQALRRSGHSVPKPLQGAGYRNGGLEPRVEDLYRQGLPLREIGVRLGKTTNRVGVILARLRHRWGVDLPYRNRVAGSDP